MPWQTVSEAGATATFGKSLTFTVTVFDFWQPVAVIVSVSVYDVVDTGLAVTFDAVVESSPVEGDQLYMLPATAVAPIEMLCPAHIV